jgi:hypothetical protein
MPQDFIFLIMNVDVTSALQGENIYHVSIILGYLRDDAPSIARIAYNRTMVPLKKLDTDSSAKSAAVNQTLNMVAIAERLSADRALTNR